jgi:hypothetical protein
MPLRDVAAGITVETAQTSETIAIDPIRLAKDRRGQSIFA